MKLLNIIEIKNKLRLQHDSENVSLRLIFLTFICSSGIPPSSFSLFEERKSESEEALTTAFNEQMI
jgi:hypothetical protein